MKRREFIGILGGAAAAVPLAAHAQQDGPVARVGVIGVPLDRPAMRVAYPFFLAELRKLGFVQGRNLLVESPGGRKRAWGLRRGQRAGRMEGRRAVRVRFELALQAAAAARPPVPIVMGAANFDPIAKGYVQSLARPGGNVTGIIMRWPELAGKQIELLQEAFPDRNRLGVLWDTQSADQFSAAEREAKARRLALRPLKLEKHPYDFAAAFRTLVQDDVQMLIVSSSPLFAAQSAQIVSLALEHRLPTMFILKHYVEAGGLMSYGVDFAPLMRRAASFVAKILRGAKPADLPVEQATHFEFVLNLKTAKAMGLTLLTSTLLRADEVIE